MKVAEDSLAHVKSVYDKAKSQVDSAPRDDGTLLEKRKELQREVDVTKRTLAQQVFENKLHFFFFSANYPFAIKYFCSLKIVLNTNKTRYSSILSV